MPKKRPNKNSFVFFMEEFQRREQALGRKFPGGLKDVQCDPSCNQQWRNLTPQEKRPYEEMAKNYKVQSGARGKLTTTGESIAALEAEARRKQEMEENMNMNIIETVNMANRKNSLHKKEFFFIHVNYFCRDIQNNLSYPAEFALARFSLEKGVDEIYNEILSVNIPLGKRYEIQQHAQNTHKISRDLDCAQKDFAYMYNVFTKMLGTDGGKYPPLYTTKELFPVVNDLLERFCDAGDTNVAIFKVYSIELLFTHLRTACAQRVDSEGFPTYMIAENELKKDVFDYTPGIECAYHKLLDGTNVYCSKSIVKRWAFTICDFCCADLGIEMTPGIHCPAQNNLDYDGPIDSGVQGFSMNDKRAINTMTPSCDLYRWKVSERTDEEERRRRLNSKKISIVDYGKPENQHLIDDTNLNDSAEFQPPVTPSQACALPPDLDVPMELATQRSLREPNTKSYAEIGAPPPVPLWDDSDFPTIGGRGRFQKSTKENIPMFGRGRGHST
ncbi:protein maelstrom homolog [Cephus cinctus]|uniref:Protein maelstrom homolog n=1 Tax=Cephus cinctus TaxID=211228 RepID=A0AAJ7BHH6_CEPCN|nr:protein maelstrom homolog [Cephus cinctus]XP_015586149.1 protein maelstrom homolog [Cephus cinctus]XP_024936447.1 protein maelstrom homolog [Cephus cinctus]